MNRKNIYLATLLFVSSGVCCASQPAIKGKNFATQELVQPEAKRIKHERFTPHEIKSVVEYKNENKTVIAIDFYTSAQENAHFIGELLYSFDHEKKEGKIDTIKVDDNFMNMGYGSAWFKKAIIALVELKPNRILWEAQPLGDCNNRKKFADLLRFYKRHGGIVKEKHATHIYNYAVMEYPIVLAHALSVLNPIFETQEQSSILSAQKQEGPFDLIAAYINEDED